MSERSEGTSDPERTEDGRWVVVDGRRWRASDPSIPEALRRELVAELMAARRAVGEARCADDEAATQRARDRVHQAKVALGERGAPWWEEPTDDQRDERLACAVRALTTKRGPGATICPSDAARAVGGAGWCDDLDRARAVGRALAIAGEVEVVQGGEPIDPESQWHGPVRLRTVDQDG